MLCMCMSVWYTWMLLLLLLDYNVQTSREYSAHDVINTSYDIIKCLNESKVSGWITWCDKEFQSLIACVKKENLYESILAYKWMNLLAVFLVKGGESIRMWECGITTRLLMYDGCTKTSFIRLRYDGETLGAI